MTSSVADARLEAGPLPLHRQLFLVLRDTIARGAVAAGGLLPTEGELCEQYGVSRITVRRALQDLVLADLVERRQGVGTFVRPPASAALPVPALSVRDGLRKAHLETTVEVLDLEVRTAPARVATALGITGDALYVLRLRSAFDVALMLSEAWLPVEFAAVLTREALATTAMNELLEQGGVTLGRVSQEITAEIADPQRSRLLSTPIGAPLLVIDRLVHDMDGTPVQQLQLALSPERSRLVFDIPASEIDTPVSGYLAHDVPAGPAKGRT